MKEMWDSRYQAKAYAYGKEPNSFFKSSLVAHGVTGKLLLPAEGEGRNAVHAAKSGLQVSAFDISAEGRKKAQKLAAEAGVSMDYQVGDFIKLNYQENSFDAAALIFAHFPPHLISPYHQKIASLVKPNGLVILEGFSKNNLPLRAINPKVGGPNKIEMLFSEESIQQDFPDFEILQLSEVETELSEGEYHQGVAKLIQFVGKKR